MRIKLKSSIIKELIPLVIVIIIALLILPTAGVQVSNNAARYLSEASKVFHEKGSGIISPGDLVVRRPLFPIMLASGFKLWGKNVQSASLTTRIFFTLTIILVYLMGRFFYGITVGLLSSSLVLTSYGVNSIARYIDTDIVLPFFILLFIFIYYVALNRSSPIWAVFAGFSLGLALMVKESALFCLGLPLVMPFLAPKGKRWKYGKISLWTIGALVAPLGLWVFYLFLTNESFHSMLQTIYKEGLTYRMRPFSDWLYLFTTGLPKTLFKYYQSFLLKATPLSFLMIIGWIFVFIRGLISKKTSDLILIILVICSLPLILLIGDVGDRLGQTTFVYVFLYITFATFVVSCISLLTSDAVKLANRYKKPNIFHSAVRKHSGLICNILIVLIGFFSIKAQLFDRNESTWKLWTDGGDSLSIFVKKPFEIYGRFIIEQEKAAEWLKKNALKNAKIIADGYTNEALAFFEVADYEIPEFHPKRGISIARFHKKRNDDAQPLYLITYGNFESGSQRHRIIFPIFEKDVVRALKRENPDYLVISGRSSFFRAYFDKARWAYLKFDNLKFSNRSVLIYEIHLERFEPVIFENVGVNETINEHLIWLEKNYPDEYLLFKEKIEALGLTIDELKNSQLRFPVGQVY